MGDRFGVELQRAREAQFAFDGGRQAFDPFTKADWRGDFRAPRMAGLFARLDGLLLPAFATGARAVGIELQFAAGGLERDDARSTGFTAGAHQVIHRAALRHALGDVNRG